MVSNMYWLFFDTLGVGNSARGSLDNLFYRDCSRWIESQDPSPPLFYPQAGQFACLDGTPWVGSEPRRHLMADTIPVTIEVEPVAAAALGDPRTRAAMGRLVSRVLNPRPGPSELAQAIADAKAEARAAGLTD